MILGGTRSGTTVLDRVLGAAPEAVSTGELRTIWQGLANNDVCGCGTALQQCEFWQQVLNEVSRNGALLSPSEAEEVLEARFRNRHLRRVARALDPTELQREPSRSDRPEAQYARLLAATYAAIQTVAGVPTVIDSSKRPADVIAAASSGSVRVIHLVRDPLDVAAAWSQAKAPSGEFGKEMEQQSILASIYSWISLNVSAGRVRRLLPEGSYLRLRYEDFVSDPARYLSEIGNFAGIGVPEIVDGHGVQLPENHMVGGNLDKHVSGLTVLSARRPATPLNQRNRALVTALTTPLRLRYGYGSGSG